MVNLEGLKTGKFSGTIVDCKDVPLNTQFKDEEVKDKFIKGMLKNLPDYLREKGTLQKEIDEYVDKRMNALVTSITFEVDLRGEIRKYTQWFNIPLTGYRKSNIKKVKDLNSLPDDTAEWINKPIFAYPDENGYLKLIPE